MCLYKPLGSASNKGKTKRKQKASPYWSAQFRDGTGKVISISTKLRDKRHAKSLEAVWLRIAEESRNGWLTIDKAKELLFECNRICRGDSLKQSERFIDSCLRQSIGSALLIPTVEGYFQQWLAAKKELGRNSENTLHRYSPVLERFLLHLSTRRSARLDSVTATDCRAFLHTEKARGISAETANQALRILRIVFNSARRDGLISTNPGEAVDLYQEDPHQREAFTVEQVQSILRVTDIEWTGMVLCGLYSGCRIGDAARLIWGNVDLEQNLLRFRAQKTARRTNKDTVVDLHRDLIDYFRSLQPGVPAAPVFPTLSHRPVGSANGLSARFKRLMDKAGVLSPLRSQNGSKRVFRALSFHSLRHLYVTQLSRAGVPIEIRRELAGHGSDAISLQYTHVDRERTARAINQLPSVRAA
jgi:integrase